MLSSNNLSSEITELQQKIQNLETQRQGKLEEFVKNNPIQNVGDDNEACEAYVRKQNACIKGVTKEIVAMQASLKALREEEERKAAQHLKHLKDNEADKKEREARATQQQLARKQAERAEIEAKLKNEEANKIKEAEEEIEREKILKARLVNQESDDARRKQAEKLREDLARARRAEEAQREIAFAEKRKQMEEAHKIEEEKKAKAIIVDENVASEEMDQGNESDLGETDTTNEGSINQESEDDEFEDDNEEQHTETQEEESYSSDEDRVKEVGQTHTKLTNSPKNTRGLVVTSEEENKHSDYAKKFKITATVISFLVISAAIVGAIVLGGGLPLLAALPAVSVLAYLGAKELRNKSSNDENKPSPPQSDLSAGNRRASDGNKDVANSPSPINKKRSNSASAAEAIRSQGIFTRSPSLPTNTPASSSHLPSLSHSF